MSEEYIFDYIVFPHGRREKKKRPVILIPIKYIGSDKEPISTFALIDSGSDINVSSKDLGEELGIIFGSQPIEEIDGLSDTTQGWTKPLLIKIGKHEIHIPVFWMNRKHNSQTDFPLILGREPFFNHFDVEFRNNNKVVLKRK